MKELCIFGAGGCAREVFFVAKACGYNVSYFIDLFEGELFGRPVKKESFFNPDKHSAAVAIGTPKLRKKIVDKLLVLGGVEFASLVHPEAVVNTGHNISFGYGPIIYKGCNITCDTYIGSWSICNLNSTIGHDAVIGKFFTASPGTNISGRNRFGDGVFFGANSSTVDLVHICDNVIVGAGACVVGDITEPGTYVGVPAKAVRGRSK